MLSRHVFGLESDKTHTILCFTSGITVDVNEDISDLIVVFGKLCYQLCHFFVILEVPTLALCFVVPSDKFTFLFTLRDLEPDAMVRCDCGLELDKLI